MPHTDLHYLPQIHSPEDLRQLPTDTLPEVANEIRQYLINTLDQCGGHFGANLGCVELAIAIHYALHTPHDRVIWDVGHQAYPHKILTGRRELLHTVKQDDGLAPFPHRKESEFDHFGTGHSSTSVSAALGMSVGSQLNEINRRTLAVIGDGGLTGGMVFEAMNHSGGIHANMTIILNDNQMSISKNVGALTEYFARVTSGHTYLNLRERSKSLLTKISSLSKLAKHTENYIKGMIQPSALFEAMGIHYLGPIDGHDIPALVKVIKTSGNIKGPKIIHVITTKGKGFSAAEKDPIKYHAVSADFHSNNKKPSSSPKKPTYSQIFDQWLCETATIDKNLTGITPAMKEGSGMIQFAEQYPQRFFDVGIAEQHAVTFAAGLACEGLKPVVAIYSTFLQRAYDQLIHDVAIQNLDVTFAIDRAGFVGGDGATHMGAFDITYLRCVPNLILMAPSNLKECKDMLSTAYQYPGPAAVRYPRGSGSEQDLTEPTKTLPIGKAQYCRRGQQVALLAFGNAVNAAIEAGNTLNATVINMRFIKPLDTDLLKEVSAHHDLLVTLEENSTMGGAGSAVCEHLHQLHDQTPVLQIGIQDEFIEHSSTEKQQKQNQLTAPQIILSVKKKLKNIASEFNLSTME